MAVAYVSHTTAAAGGWGGAGGNLSVGVPSGLAAGDLWVIDAVASGPAASLSISGFTAVSAQQVGAEGEPVRRTFWKIAGAGESAVTLVVGSGGYDAFATSIRLTGAHATTPIGNTATATAGTSTTRVLDAPDITIQNAGSLALLCFASEGDTGTHAITAPSGSTALTESTINFPSARVAYELRDAGAYAPGNWTQGGGDGDVWDGIAQTIEIIPSAGGSQALAGAATGGATASADASVTKPISGDATGGATAAGTLLGDVPLAGAATGGAAASAALTVESRRFEFTLYQVDGATPLASKTGLWWAWWPSLAAVRSAAPDASGTGASTDASGVFSVVAPSALSAGANQGFGIISDQDATPDATEAAFVGSFDVV